MESSNTVWEDLLWFQVMTDYDSEGHDTDTETNLSTNVSHKLN